MKGKEYPVPKYYDRLFELSNPDDMIRIKSVRKDKAKLYRSDQSPERLAVKLKVKSQMLSKLVRTLD